jgi:hypothetical protein
MKSERITQRNTEGKKQKDKEDARDPLSGRPPPVFYYFCPSFIDIWPTIKLSLSALQVFKQTHKHTFGHVRLGLGLISNIQKRD